MGFSQLAQAFIQAVMIGAAGVFDTQRAVKLVRGLAVAHGSHIDGDQFGHILRETDRSAVPDFLIVREVQGDILGGFQTGIVQGFDSRDDVGDTGLVVQMAGADEPVIDFHPGIKGDKITNLNTQLAGFFLR